MAQVLDADAHDGRPHHSTSPHHSPFGSHPKSGVTSRSLTCSVVMPKFEKPLLDLKHFIVKQEVKTLYRRIFRAINQIQDPVYRQELKEWTRRDFRANAHHTDLVSIKMYLNYGEKCLRQLENTINLAK